jgi:hypothetical protein
MANVPDSKPTRGAIARSAAHEARRKQPSTPSLATQILSNAPRELVFLHDNYANGPWSALIADRVRPKSIAMLGKLISDTRMKNVWKVLFERSLKLSRSANYGLAIFTAAQEALLLIDRPRRSYAEEKKLFSGISDLIGKLIYRIDKAGMFGPCEVEEFMTADELHKLALLTHTPVLTKPDDTDLAPDISGDSFVDTRVKTWGIIPALPELLRRLQHKTTTGKASALWKQPRSTSAGRNLFAICICNHINENYKQHMDECVGIFTSVALNLGPKEEIDGNLVYQLRRTRSSSSRKTIRR